MKVIEKYCIKKIIVTTLSLFLLLLFIIIPTKTNKSINIENEKVNKKIFLLDKDNYTSLVFFYYDDLNIYDEIKKRIDILKNGIKDFDGVIPKDVVLQNIKIDKNNVYLDFNNKLIDAKNIKKTLECLTYSLCEINGIDNIYISINNKMLNDMPLNKNYGVNEEYDLDEFNFINKTIVYFSKDYYYVPITKINNESKEKIEIIIKELKSSVNALNNLVGYLTDDIELLDYKITKDKIELVFNYFIFDDERAKFILSSSIFQNYDVREVIIYNKDKSISISIKK